MEEGEGGDREGGGEGGEGNEERKTGVGNKGSGTALGNGAHFHQNAKLTNNTHRDNAGDEKCCKHVRDLFCQ